VSLVCVDEHQLLKDIERLIKRPIPQEIIVGFEPDPSAKPEPIQRRSQGGGGGQRSPRQGAPRREGAGSNGAKPAGGNGGGNGNGSRDSRSQKPMAAKPNGNPNAPRKADAPRPAHSNGQRNAPSNAGALLGGKPRGDGAGAGRRDTPRSGQRHR
jgi:ATP-dependent RNA helicase RhlE